MRRPSHVWNLLIDISGLNHLKAGTNVYFFNRLLLRKWTAFSLPIWLQMFNFTNPLHLFTYFLFPHDSCDIKWGNLKIIFLAPYPKQSHIYKQQSFIVSECMAASDALSCKHLEINLTLFFFQNFSSGWQNIFYKTLKYLFNLHFWKTRVSRLVVDHF